jgi:NhaP-type Na+/H+ or K+/H+ antiporter
LGDRYWNSYGHCGEIAEKISWITYTTVIVSVILHGISATPLMNWYERHIAESRNTHQPATIDEFE